MNGDAEMLSNTWNAGSRILWGEGVRSPNRSPPCCRGWRLGGEKLFVDSQSISPNLSDRIWWKKEKKMVVSLLKPVLTC